MKNSWGDNWGDKGYIKIERGKSQCGIGQICAVATCEKTSGTLSTVPAPPPPAPIPAIQTCDLNSYYPGLTGSYLLHIKGKKNL